MADCEAAKLQLVSTLVVLHDGFGKRTQHTGIQPTGTTEGMLEREGGKRALYTAAQEETSTTLRPELFTYPVVID